VLPSSVDLEVEFESIAFVDSRKARALHRADVDERVFLAIVAGDEAEALHRIEELDRSRRLLAGQLALRAGGLLLYGDHVTDDLQIGRGNLATAIDQVEGKLLPFGQAFEAGALDLADVDEHVLTALIALDEAEALLGIEEFYHAGAGADDVGGHAAASRRATIASAETPAAPAVPIAETVPATEAVPAARRAPIITPVAGTARKRVDTFFSDTVPLVAPPAATSFIVTHEPNAPSLRFCPPAAARAKSNCHRSP